VTCVECANHFVEMSEEPDTEETPDFLMDEEEPKPQTEDSQETLDLETQQLELSSEVSLTFTREPDSDDLIKMV
jgi:hypothetical protein